MALDFPNPNQNEEIHLGLGNLNVPVGTGALSITAWVNPDQDGLSEDMSIIAKSDTTGNDGPFKLQLEEPDLELRGIINDNQLTGPSTIVPGVWSFLAMVYDTVNKTLFINGVQDDTEADAGGDIVRDSSAFRIAATDDGSIKRELDGLLEDVRFYTRALSLAEILTMFTLRGKDNIINGLLWRWKMNERAPGQTATVASSIIDLAGNFNATPVNTPIYQAGILN